MSGSLLFQMIVLSRGVILALAALLFFPIPQSTWGQDPPETTETRDRVRTDLPLRVYARWALDNFDADKDGLLTKEEMEEMRSPLLAAWYDKNGDGKLGFDEIVEAIRRPSSAKIEEEPTRNSSRESAESTYVKYAKGLLNAYDRNRDGLISKDENKKMRRPIADSADANKDGLFSLNELAGSLAEMNAPIQNPRPVIAVTGDLNLEVESLTRRMLEASLNKNDKNNDGKLDADEIAQTSWSTIRWQDSDTNQDGVLSRDELGVRYKEMFSQLMTGPWTSPGAKKQTPMSKEQANELLALWANSARSNKQPGRPIAEGAMLGSDRRGDTMAGNLRSGRPSDLTGGTLAGNPGDLLGGLMGAAENRNFGNGKNVPTRDFFNVEVYLLRLPVNSDSERLANAVQELTESDQPTGDIVRALAKRLGILGYDQLTVGAATGRSTSVQSGASVPMITGSSQSARGRTYDQQMVDVGLRVDVKPEPSDEGILLELKIEKSDLLVTEKEDEDIPENLIVQWTYNSSVQIKPGEPAVIGSSSSRQHWILVVDATRVQ